MQIVLRKSIVLHKTYIGGIKKSKFFHFPTILFSLFAVATLLVPKAPMNKWLFVMLYVGFILDKISSRRPQLTLMPAFLIVFTIFVYGFTLSLVGNSEKEIVIQYFLSIFILPLVYYIERYNIDIERVVIFSGIILLIGTGIFFMCSLWPTNPLSRIVLTIFESYSYAGIDFRVQKFLNAEINKETTLKTYMLGTTPFLFLPWSIIVIRLIQSFRIIDVVLLFFFGWVILFSGSRALVAISVLFLLFVIQDSFSSYRRILVIVASGIFLYVCINYLLNDTIMLSSSEGSNQGKIGHITSFINDLTWSSAFFGRGLACYYFSSGSGAFQSYTEITPMDMMRYFGIPLMILLYLCILFPSSRFASYAKNKNRVIAMIMYIFMSATNPVMFNSFGMLVVLYYWTKLREA